MHYKNGTEAKHGDTLLRKHASGAVIVGVITSIYPGAESCDAMIAVVVPGGIIQETVTLNECYSIADAFEAIDSAEKPQGKAGKPKRRTT